MIKMKRILSNKTFITIIGTIVCFLIMTGIFYAISQGISGSIDITIGINK